MFWCKVNLDGVEHKMQTLALSAADLEEPLRVFGAYMLKKAKRKYEAQNFPPLAQSTIAHRVSKGMRSIERKLNRDLRRAGNKLGKGVIEQIAAQSSRGYKNRAAVLGAFQRQHGFRLTKTGLDQRANLQELSVKQAASLTERTARAVDKAVNKPILSGLVDTLNFDVSGGSMTLRSTTAREWSNVHNAGGQAGHGATIPKRETIAIEPVDLEVLASILKSYLLLPFQEGLQGPGF